MEDVGAHLFFQEEISRIMFGFGDNLKPNPDTVKLIESIVLKQLRDILYDATKIAGRKRYKVINSEDLVFLLRHDKFKMQRFLRLLHFKKNCTQFTESEPGVYNVDQEPEPKKKKSSLEEFLEDIDITGELTDLEEHDAVKEERALRTERLSAALNEQAYIEFSKARTVSFVNKFRYKNKTFNFHTWVDPGHELSISPSAVDVLAHMAYGIVGHIVDMVFIVRQNSQRTSNDLTKMEFENKYNPTMFNVPHMLRNDMQKDYDFSKMQVNQAPISVNEVREVMRRCYMPQTGYVKFSNKSMVAKRKYFCI